ncbi:MAG TPA: hypothetical protein VLM80_13190 [Anaerolineales bacterium]|nr:hypothetical protein [Anaerolineales bacterium]
MEWLKSRIVWGSLLVVFGILVLLQNFGLFTLSGITGAVLFSFGGVFFISLYIDSRERWWALIPGFTLLSIALSMVASLFAPQMAEQWSGLIILGGIGLSFLAIFLLDQHQWWAIIPAGVMITLGVVAGIGDALGIDGGAIFFLGLGLTFAAVAIIPTPEGRMKWAWIPAGILLLMGVLLFSSTVSWFQYFWPAALILAGGYLIIKNFVVKN